MASFRQLLLTFLTIGFPLLAIADGLSGLFPHFQVDTIHLSLYKTDIACYGENTGSVTPIIDGGSTDYTFNWSGPNDFVSHDFSITNLEAGYYYLEVADNINNFARDSIEILQPESGISLVMIPDTICYGTSDGVVSVITTGGNPPYSYEWSNTQVDTFSTGLSSGSHFVTVTDDHHCTAIGEVNIHLRPEILVHAHSDAASCHHAYDGSATLDSIMYDGTTKPLESFSFTWNTIPVQYTTTVSGLLGGEFYKVTITDEFGCSAIKIFGIDHPDSIILVVDNVNDASCFEGSDGEAQVHAEGGTAPYEYSWDAEANDQTGDKASDLARGIYQVIVVDTFGCTTAINIDIDEPEKLYATLTVKDAACKDGLSGSASIEVGGGTPPYTYLWSSGDETKSPVGLKKGNYTVKITDLKGCVLSDSIEVKEPNSYVGATLIPHAVTCYDGINGTIDVLAYGGTPGYEAGIDGINYYGTDVLISLEAGEHQVYVRDDNGCIFTEMVTIDEPLPVTVDLGPDTTIELGEDIVLTPIITNSVGQLEYRWTALAGFPLSCDDCPNPSTQNLNYSASYELVVIDENNCAGVDVIGINVLKNRMVVVPTAFSPNGDNLNDLLLVHGKPKTKILLFQVFDRRGEMVYMAKDFPINSTSIGWDGKFRGKYMNQGVFAWYMEVEFKDGEKKKYQGTTVLVR